MKSASLLCLSAALVGSTAASSIRLKKNGQYADITFDENGLNVPGHATLNVTDSLSSRIDTVAGSVATLANAVAANTQGIFNIEKALLSSNNTQ